MKMRSFLLAPVGLLMLTTACAHQPHNHGHGDRPNDSVQPKPIQQVQYEDETIRVSGRGTVVPDVTQTQAQ
ncbi:MAG: hypothetical protein ACLFRJ_07625, partial [Ectothiorhodospira sp.]